MNFLAIFQFVFLLSNCLAFQFKKSSLLEFNFNEILIVNELNYPITESYDKIENLNRPFVAFANVEAFLNSEINQKNKSSFLYFQVENVETLHVIIEKLNTLPILTQTHLQISLDLSSGNRTSSFEISTFLVEIKFFILKSNFFQNSPLLLEVVWNGLDSKLFTRCFFGYRTDTIHSHVILNDVTTNVCQQIGTVGPNEGLFHAALSATATNNFVGSTLIGAGVVPWRGDPDDFNYDTQMALKFVNGNGIEEFTFADGFAVNLMVLIKDYLNFSITPYKSVDWGYYNLTTERWIGAVGDILNNEIDICISSTAAASIRAASVDFNIATTSISVAVFFKRVPSYATGFEYSLLAPFELDLWIAIALWILANCLVYWKFIKSAQQFANSEEQNQRICVGNVFSMGFNPLCQRGCNWLPTNYGIRVLYYFQLLGGLVLYSAYAGTLVSFLAVEKNAFTKLKDLVSPRLRFPYKFAVVDYLLTRQYFTDCSCSEPAVYEIFKKSIVPGTKDEFIQIDEPYKHVNAGTLAYVVDDITTYVEFEKWDEKHPGDTCKIQSITLSGTSQPQGTFVKKSSHIKRAIDFSIIKLMETGNVICLKRRYLPKKPNCKKQREFVEAGYDDLKVAYYLLFSFAILSILILVVELFQLKYKISQLLRFGWLN